MLRQLAPGLGGRVRAHDTAARVGGDEFIVILTELQDAAGACRVTEQVIADTADIASWRQHQLHVGASVGIALYPDHAGAAASLRARADAAMYDAKRAGRNNWRSVERIDRGITRCAATIEAAFSTENAWPGQVP